MKMLPVPQFKLTTGDPLVLVLLVTLLFPALAQTDSLPPSGFPRIMGIAIGRKDYADRDYQRELSRADVLVVGFYPGWRGPNGETMRDSVKAIKALNRNLLVGQYTLLSEVTDPKDRRYADSDLGRKIDAEGWWLRDAVGRRVQWTDQYDAWEVNISRWAKQDSDGKRYPEWQATRNYKQYFAVIPELDIWFLDNALSRPAVALADWDGDGRDDSREDTATASAYRQGHVSNWSAARTLRPGILLVANADDVSSPEFTLQLDGVLMEAVIGKSWSMERWKGWSAVMRRYAQTMAHTRAPKLVAFNIWGPQDDYRRMRYGLTSCLLNDGYFSYTDEAKGYGSLPWFDEYDADLGKPLQAPQLSPWRNGIYRREFERGLVLVNPTGHAVTLDLERGFRKITGRQDSRVNDGAVASRVIVPARDGLVLLRDP
jgi:hypothetical protein